MVMCAWRVVTGAASVAFASSGDWMTRPRAAASWAMSPVSMVVAMLPGFPPTGTGIRDMAPRRLEVDIDGRTVSLSNLDKVMYPRAGFTKGHVIDYYTRIAPVLLPHLRGRPLTLKRYPDGIEGQYFSEKQCPSHRAPWVRTADVPTRSKS